MNETIKKIFGESVQEKDYHFPAGTPNYLRYRYRVSQLFWREKTCLLVVLLEDDWNLPSLKKQLKMIEKLCGMSLIVELRRISALRRTKLIESGIAFVSGTGQLFVPFWGSYFEEKIKNPVEEPEGMNANAQLVFLYLYYQKGKREESFKLTQISQKLGIPKSTCTRTIQRLEGLGLIKMAKEGTSKWVRLSDDNEKKMLERAMAYMISPIQQKVYIKDISLEMPYKISGLKALADTTMLAQKEGDGGYAVSKTSMKKIARGDFVDRQQFEDFGGKVIEVWKYDPFLLSETRYVDDISLILSLQDDSDERVQNELDVLRGKYGIDKGEEGWQQE